MKLMIASDIHGSSYYCEKLLLEFRKERPDKLLLLGDLLYHGPRNELPKDYNPKEVIGMLNEIKEYILCVRGNCEAEVDQQVLKFPILAEYAIFYLENRTIFASHGHKYNEENPPYLNPGDILLNGHTHVPRCSEHLNYIYMNPGSVSIPKENTANSYMVLDGSSFYWKSLDGYTFKTYDLAN